MDTKPQSTIDTGKQLDIEDDKALDMALQQMEVLYKSRCVQASTGANITIREVKKEE
ncbi:MAG: hypothetical protein OEL83_01425 [Desulforhopalus sp.]|nr:hypothetical protein [Desulforhopalus sp.]